MAYMNCVCDADLGGSCWIDRTGEDSEQMPADLIVAAGVAEHLLDASSPLLASSTAGGDDAPEKSAPAASPAVPAAVRLPPT